MKARSLPLALALIASAALGPSAHAALMPARAVQQVPQQMQNDMRDLTPLPQTPHDTYTGEYDSDSPKPVPSGAPRGTRGGSQVSTSAQAKRSGAEKFLDNVDLYYGFFLNGPSVGSDWGTTYNPFAQGTWPMYIYHTADVQYHFDRANLIGAELAIHQDVQSGVTPSGQYKPVDPQLVVNDPQFWYTHKGLLRNSYFSTDLTFDVWPALTSYSMNQMGEYFAAGVDTTWNLNLRDRRWTAYFTTRFKPTFYADLEPGDMYNREWLLLTTGYYVGYSLSYNWQVNVSGIFDCNFYADDTQLWNRGPGSDDRAQLEVNYYLGRIARVGAYFQTVVTSLSLVSSIVGLDITINLLSAK